MFFHFLLLSSCSRLPKTHSSCFSTLVSQFVKIGLALHFSLEQIFFYTYLNYNQVPKHWGILTLTATAFSNRDDFFTLKPKKIILCESEL